MWDAKQVINEEFSSSFAPSLQPGIDFQSKPARKIAIQSGIIFSGEQNRVNERLGSALCFQFAT
jgi:hypothetical protein